MIMKGAGSIVTTIGSYHSHGGFLDPA